MKYFYSIVLTLLSATLSFAANRSVNDASLLAQKKLGGTVSLVQVKTHNADTLCYVYNRLGGGYAVISADDRTPDVLAYDEKNLFSGKLPAQLERLLVEYNGAVGSLPKDGRLNLTLKTKSSRLRASHLLNCAVEPLLGDVAWGQQSPFNDACPLSDNERTVAGCAAISAAQVLHYYQHPKALTNDIPSYFCETLGKIVEGEKKGTVIDWGNIADNYVDGFTAKQAKAVSELVLYLGKSMNMEYDVESSGTYSNLAYELVTFFGYDPDLMHMAFRNSFTLEEYNELLFNELKEKRPLIVSGNSFGGGHSFVIDGMDNDGMFHVNWGWDGDCNGYYDVTLLNPGTTSAVGASSSDDGYTMELVVCYGITPDNGVADAVSDEVVAVADIEYQKQGNLHLVYPSYYNLTTQEQTVVLGLGYVDKNGEVVSFGPLYDDEPKLAIAPGGFYEVMVASPLNPDNFKNGEVYNIILIQQKPDGTWVPCQGSNSQFASLTKKNGDLVKLENDYVLGADLVVNGFNQVGLPAYCNIHFTNDGTKEYCSPFYFFTNDVDQVPEEFTFAAGITVEPNNFNDIDFSFVPQSDVVYYWITDEDFQTIKKGSFTFNKEQFLLNASFSDISVNGEKIKLKVEVENPNSYAYNELLTVVCVDRETMEVYDGYDKIVSVKPNETVVLEFEFQSIAEYNNFYLIDAHANRLAFTSYSPGYVKQKAVDIQLAYVNYEKVGENAVAGLFIGNYSDAVYDGGAIVWINNVIETPTEYVAYFDDDVPTGSSTFLEVEFKGTSDTICFWITDLKGNVYNSGMFIANQKSATPLFNSASPAFNVATVGNLLVAEATDDAQFVLYSASGVCLAKRDMKQGEKFEITLTSGIYIANHKKVIVR